MIAEFDVPETDQHVQVFPHQLEIYSTEHKQVALVHPNVLLMLQDRVTIETNEFGHAKFIRDE